MQYNLVVDLHTNRVVWFTSNINDAIKADSGSAIARYEGQLPEGMTVSNSWNYVFENKVLKKKETPGTQPGLSNLETNRVAVKKYINDTITNKRNERFPKTVYDALIHMFTKDDLRRENSIWKTVLEKEYYENVDDIFKIQSELLEIFLFKTELLKQEALRDIVTATSTDELFKIKEKFNEHMGKL